MSLHPTLSPISGCNARVSERISVYNNTHGTNVSRLHFLGKQNIIFQPWRKRRCRRPVVHLWAGGGGRNVCRHGLQQRPRDSKGAKICALLGQLNIGRSSNSPKKQKCTSVLPTPRGTRDSRKERAIRTTRAPPPPPPKKNRMLSIVSKHAFRCLRLTHIRTNQSQHVRLCKSTVQVDDTQKRGRHGASCTQDRAIWMSGH